MKRLLRYVPVVAVIVMIFFLTMQNAQDTVRLSNGFGHFALMLCEKLGLDTIKTRFDSSYEIRHIGHLIEYFALGVAAAFSFKKKIYALLICVGISVTDQILKIYVPGRHFDWMDLPFDVVGYISGLIITWTVILLISELRRKATE